MGFGGKVKSRVEIEERISRLREVQKDMLSRTLDPDDRFWFQMFQVDRAIEELNWTLDES